MRFGLSLLAGTVSALLAGCGEDETRVEQAPYAGDAWPEESGALVVPAAGLGLVTDSLSDTISAIDLGTGAVVATRPVGRNPVDVDGVHHLAVDPRAGFAYVGLSYPVPGGAGPHAGHGASQALGWVQQLSLSDLSITGQVRVQTNPGDIVLSEDGSRLIVSHFDLTRASAADATVETARATLAVIDPTTIAPTGSPEPRFVSVCAAPHGLALSRPDARFVFVACYAEDALAIVDLEVADGGVVRVPLGAGTVFGSVAYGPYAAVLSPDGARVAVTSIVSRDLRFFDVAAGAFEDQDPIVFRGSPFFPTWSDDGTSLWVPTQAPDTIVRVDAATGDIEERAFRDDDGCTLPHEAERLPDGRIALVCEGDRVADGSVLLLDPGSLETLARADVGVFPDAIERIGPEGAP